MVNIIMSYAERTLNNEPIFEFTIRAYLRKLAGLENNLSINHQLKLLIDNKRIFTTTKIAAILKVIHFIFIYK